VQKYLPFFGIALVLLIAGCTTTEEKQATDSSLQDIKDKGTLVVGLDAPFGVMEFFDESGNLVGVDIDVAEEIASAIGVDLEYKNMPFDELFDAVKNEEVDVIISTVTITPERQETMLFSIPYFDGGNVVVAGSEYRDMELPEALLDTKVGALKGTTGEAFILDYAGPSLVTSYVTNEEMNEDLLAGDVDVIVIDYIAAIDLVKKYPSLEVIGGSLNQAYYGVITKLGNDALMEEINKILREIKRSGRLKEITDTWIN
jgi:ABC-type amino acid transport substrate-binding protein